MNHKRKGCSSFAEMEMVVFRERVSDFSLEYREIRPSAVFGARRKNVLRGTGYAWTPGSGVLQTPRGRILSLLGFYSHF